MLAVILQLWAHKKSVRLLGILRLLFWGSCKPIRKRIQIQQSHAYQRGTCCVHLDHFWNFSGFNTQDEAQLAPNCFYPQCQAVSPSFLLCTLASETVCCSSCSANHRAKLWIIIVIAISECEILWFIKHCVSNQCLLRSILFHAS